MREHTEVATARVSSDCRIRKLPEVVADLQAPLPAEGAEERGLRAADPPRAVWKHSVVSQWSLLPGDW